MRRRAELAHVTVFLLLASFVAAMPSRVDARSAPSIGVPAEIKVAPSVATRLPIEINLPDIPSPHPMLVVRGVPARVTLSEGRLFAAGVWVVPLSAIGKLEIAPAAGSDGTADLSFEIVTLDGKVLASTQSALSIEPQAANETARNKSLVLTTGTLNAATEQERGGGSSAAASPPSFQLSPEDAEKARKLMARGDENMAAAKITAARLLYQAAADMGWAPAAVALAKTYDPNELAHAAVMGGVRPDPALAQKWYEKARALGSPEAGRRLQALQTSR